MKEPKWICDKCEKKVHVVVVINGAYKWCAECARKRFNLASLDVYGCEG